MAKTSEGSIVRRSSSVVASGAADGPAARASPDGDGPERAEILQGTLELLILRVLNAGPNHGYGIAKRLRESSGEVILVEEGSLYPALHRLGKRGFVESEWRLTETNRRARFYRLTQSGRGRLESQRASWTRVSTAIDQVLSTARRAAGELLVSEGAPAPALPGAIR